MQFDRKRVTKSSWAYFVKRSGRSYSTTNTHKKKGVRNMTNWENYDGFDRAKATQGPMVDDDKEVIAG
jgi:hypothetical protein